MGELHVTMLSSCTKRAVRLTCIWCPMQKNLAAARQLQQHEAMQVLGKKITNLQHEQQILQGLLGRLCNFDPKQRMTLQELQHDSALVSLSQLGH